MRRLRVGIVGCGNIAGPYAEDLVSRPEIELMGVADLDAERAAALARKFGCRAYRHPTEMLADETVELIVNLTVHHAHYEVTRQCLEAGKHVHSEKPLALSHAEACELVALADRRGLRLGCSPFTFMGEAQETARKLIRRGDLGTVRVAYAEVNWGRIESWHPAPESFYRVGPLVDVAVYPLALLTATFGPARRLRSYGTVLSPDRVTKDGRPFQVATSDFQVTLVELHDGPLVRLTSNFYVSQASKQTGMEFHGDAGSLHLGSWFIFDTPVEFARYGEPYGEVPPVKPAQPGIRWGRAVADMARAIGEGRPHRATGEHAAHLVEILNAAQQSMESGATVDVHSSFELPAPMEWAT